MGRASGNNSFTSSPLAWMHVSENREPILTLSPLHLSTPPLAGDNAVFGVPLQALLDADQRRAQQQGCASAARRLRVPLFFQQVLFQCRWLWSQSDLNPRPILRFSSLTSCWSTASPKRASFACLARLPASRHVLTHNFSSLPLASENLLYKILI